MDIVDHNIFKSNKLLQFLITLRDIDSRLNEKNAFLWAWLTDSFYYTDRDNKKTVLLEKSDLKHKINELKSKGDYLAVQELLNLAENYNENFLEEFTSRSFRIRTPMYFKLINIGLNNRITLNKILATFLVKKTNSILQELPNGEKIIQERLETIKKTINNWLEELLVNSKKYSRENYYIYCDWKISPELQKKLSRLVYYYYGWKFVANYDLRKDRQEELLKIFWNQYENISEKIDDEFFELWLFFTEVPEKHALYCDFWINYYYHIVPFVSALEEVLPSTYIKELHERLHLGVKPVFSKEDGKRKSIFLLLYGKNEPTTSNSIEEGPTKNLEVLDSSHFDLNDYEGANFPVPMTLLDFLISLTEDGNLLIDNKYSLEDQGNLLKAFKENSDVDVSELESELETSLKNEEYQRARKINDQLVIHSLHRDIVTWLNLNFHKLMNSSQVVSLRLPKSLDLVIQAFRDQIDLSEMILRIKEFDFSGVHEQTGIQ